MATTCSTDSSILFRLILRVVGTIFFSVTVLFAPDAHAAPRFGLWVEAEGKNKPFESLETFREHLKFTAEGGFTDLYCQVYRGGRSWFPSNLADDTPYRDAVKGGFDPLREIIDHAHARGQRVHAWINVLRATRNFDAPLFGLLGRDVALVDNYGTSLLDYDDEGLPPGELGKYFKLGTPGIWLDPSSNRLRRYLANIVREVLRAYPDIDGIHLDMIRFPFALATQPGRSLPAPLSFGYSPRAVHYFYGSRDEAAVRYLVVPDGSKPSQAPNSKVNRTEKGVPSGNRKKATSPTWLKGFTQLPHGEKWEEWRRSQVTLVVFQIRDVLQMLAPDKELSAAVLAWKDRAYKNAFQDWQEWLDSGLIDTVIPMAYTKNVGLARELSKTAVTLAGSDRQALIGLGAWLLVNRSSELVAQVEGAKGVGAQGTVLFSFSNLFSDEGRRAVSRVRDSYGLPSLLVPPRQ